MKTSDVTIPWIINQAGNKVSLITLVTRALRLPVCWALSHLRLNVYKNKYKLALTLLSDPYKPINKNKGGKMLSKKI